MSSDSDSDTNSVTDMLLKCYECYRCATNVLPLCYRCDTAKVIAQEKGADGGG